MKIISRKFFKHALGIFAIAAASLDGNAAEVTSLPGGTVLTMPAVNYSGSGPQTLAPGVTWTSENEGSLFGYNGPYNFGLNGSWNDLTMIGLNGESETMTLAFATAVQGVGAFINWGRYGSASIAVYDVNHTLIESTAITFSTSSRDNSGQFHGFLEAVANISYFTFTGADIGAANITVSAVPEPEILAMLLAGLGLIACTARRRRKASLI